MTPRTNSEKTRIALKLAYIGDRYHGFQIQSNAYAVETEIFASLREAGIASDITELREARYTRSARTDTGVHAFGQVIAFDTESGFGDLLPRIINSRLPDDIWVWAYADVPLGFNARKDAISREYRYFLYDRGYNIDRMRESAFILTGRHDFLNFTKAREDTVRTIDRITIHKRNGFIAIDVAAQSFLWNMVRRIVSALELIGEGTRDRDWLWGLLNFADNADVECQGPKPAPAYGLVLRNVVFDGVEWIVDRYSKRRMKEAFSEMMVRHATMKEIYLDSDSDSGL
uniref:tRNA pseudouridine synthase A n=1 Tax=Candidatus Methanogaster sp. ANME-2c ERB4 TaxID=2759911 RepID=A0A7G9YJ49_9EURY|nr:tRNA pseudouridine synthase A [Methanosarcinales archaeon ANME-2c ERB4]